MWPRILRILLAAYVAATALHIGWVMGHEPFSFDAWTIALDTGGKPFTVGRFFDDWSHAFLHGDPRLGHALAYLAYKLDWFAELATPIAYLGLTLGITVLGLGRWPRGRDLALWAIAIGCGWFVFPELGRIMFGRASGASYIYGAAIQLWFLVPLRLMRGVEEPAGSRATTVVDRPRGERVPGAYFASTRAIAAYAAAGFVAGACNEHTGPALCAFLLGYAWWRRRRGERPRLVWAGAVGFAAGFAALVFAPGQSARFEGLATRVVQRGIGGNAELVGDYVLAAAPVLALLVIVLAIAQLRDPWDDDRRERRASAVHAVVLALAFGIALTVTLMLAPAHGSRFYLFAIALLLASALAVIDVVLVRPRQLVPLVALAVAASIYAAASTVPVFARVARQGEDRMAALDATLPGELFVADGFDPVDASWWFAGDDLRESSQRQLVAAYFGLSRIVFRGYDAKALLGMSAVRVVPRHWVHGEIGAFEDYTFDLSGARGFDIASILAETRTSITALRAQMVPHELERFDLVVEFVGKRPPLPRSRILLARWRADPLEGYTGTIVRAGGSRRDITLGKELAGKPFEIYILQVGGEFRRLGTTHGESLGYQPWRAGIYWALACDENECWVIAAARDNG